MSQRVLAERELLQLHYDRAEYHANGQLHWFLVNSIRTPAGWAPDRIPVVFFVTQGYPGAQPYGLFVPQELTHQGKPPRENPPKHPPPFPGNWRFLSWSPTNWHATTDIQSGSNLWAWVRTFVRRLEEGL